MIVYQIKIIQHTGSDQSEKLVFDSSMYDDQCMLQDPVCKLEIGKAGSLEFKVLPTSEFYNSFNRLTTEIFLTEDGNEIFRGRVYETTVGIDKIKEVTCEGDIAYLSDTIQDPDKVKKDLTETKSVIPTVFESWHENLQVTSTRPVVCACTKANVSPTITVNCSMKVTFKGTSYNLSNGSNVVSGIKFDLGDNELLFAITTQTYSRNSSYSVGDVVYYMGSAYRCKEAVTPPVTPEPDPYPDPDDPNHDDQESFDFDWEKWEILDGRIQSIVFEGAVSEYSSTFESTDEETTKETIAAHFARLIGNHKTQVGSNNWRHFELGVITVDDSDKAKEFEAANYRDTFEAIDSDIIDLYGGYLRTRHLDNTTYIDLIKEYSVTASQELTFGENVIEFSDKRDASEIFTVLIPVGDDDLTLKDLDDESADGDQNIYKSGKTLINKTAMNQYGKIYKVEQFNGITEVAELKRAAIKYMEREIETDPIEVTITAYDLRHLNPFATSINLGDKVKIHCPELGLTRTCDCMEKTIDLLKPESTEYVLGKQKQSLSMKSKKNNSSASEGIADGRSRGGAAGSAAGKIYKTLIETGNNLLIQAEKLAVKSKEIELNTAKIKYYEENGVSVYNLDKSLSILDVINAKNIVTDSLTSRTVTDLHGTLLQYGHAVFHGDVNFTGGSFHVKGRDATRMLVRVQDGTYVNNSKTVTFYHLLGDTDTITFSRAIGSFSVTRSGGTLKVNTTPQDQSTSITISMDSSRDGYKYYIWVDADTVSGTFQNFRSMTIDAGWIYDEGWGDGYDANAGSGWSSGYRTGYSNGYNDHASGRPYNP